MSATTPKKRATENAKIGFLHNVSQLKTSRNNNKYFNAVLQTMCEYEDLVCFKADLHATFRDMEQARTPVSLSGMMTTPSRSPEKAKRGIFDLKFLSGSQITKPTDPVSFIYKQPPQQQFTLMNISDIIKNSAPYEKVSVRCKIVKATTPTTIESNKQTKSTITLADKTGHVACAFWNDQIKAVEVGKSYEVLDLSVREFANEKTLTTTFATAIKHIEDITNTVKVPEQPTKWDTIQCVNVSKTYNCINCHQLLNQPTSQTVKCTNCQRKMLADNVTQQTKISVVVNKVNMTIPLQELDLLNPSWKSMSFSDLEDYLLLKVQVKTQTNQIIALKFKGNK